MRRVLIVNHDEELVLLLKLELGEILPDVAVNTATSLTYAVELARTRQPDLVVLGVDGWSTEARAVYHSLERALQPQPIFILVGHQPSLQRVRDLPAVSHLSRPVKVRAFREALHRVSMESVVREDVRSEADVRSHEAEGRTR